MKIEQSIRIEYEKKLPDYEFLSEQVAPLLRSTCASNDWHFISRLKKLESFALKVITGRYQGYLIDDFFACTIVVQNLRCIEAARTLVRSNFDIVTEKPGINVKTRPTDFVFDGIRLTCKLKNSVNPTPLHKLEFELQIKTFLEHAWTIATHDFSYKGEKISWARERVAAQIKAILENADLSILEAERLAESDYLMKRNERYKELNETSEFIKNHFNAKFNVALPKDLKRLTQEIYRILKAFNVSLEQLEKFLLAETALGRGCKTKNLSIYSIILVSIYNQDKHTFVKKLERTTKKQQNTVVIPHETELKDVLDEKILKRASFL